MIVTKKWLNDFVDLKNITTKQIEEAFTFSGFEVEEIKDLSEKLNFVVVGEIKEITKHPNADKLLVCQISDGKTIHQIITHATNMKVNDYVPMALEGADLTNGVKIKKADMRGIPSCGMMCAGEELGIDNSVYPGAETDGIMILNKKDCYVGENMAEVLGMDDVVFDIKVLANRPDCQSVMGLAKELACSLKLKFKMPNLKYKTNETKVNEQLKIAIDNKTENCEYFRANIIENIKLEKSPKWMQQRLLSVGLRPINNIVDITNYVLWEMGQPLHAYDYSQIAGEKIIIRQASSGEKITLLNEQELTLSENNMVIANAKNAMGLAGVMGGKDYSINQNTQNIVLESATFKKENIRKTSRGFGLRSDASARYERGVECVSCDLGAERALALIDELNVGVIDKLTYLSNSIETKPKVLTVSYNRILRWLGVDIPVDEAINILNNLDIKTTYKDDNLICEVPAIRADIKHFADIAEEIIRYYGFDTMKSSSNTNTKTIAGGYEKIVEQENFLKNVMLSSGANEIRTYTWHSPNELEKLNIDKNSELYLKQVKIKNPLNVSVSTLRTQMLSSVLGAVKFNLNHKNSEFSLFEIGKVFFNKNENALPEEREFLSFAISSKKADFFDVKKIVEMIASRLDLTFVYEKDLNNKNELAKAFHPNICANIVWANKIVGTIGKVHPKVLKNYEISGDVYYFELNINDFPLKKARKIKELAKYPSSQRDLALVVKKELPVGKLLEQVKKSAGVLCESVEFFDVYEGEQLGEDEKSVAIRLVFRKKDGTLTLDEVNKQIDIVLSDVETKLNAKLRELWFILIMQQQPKFIQKL